MRPSTRPLRPPGLARPTTRSVRPPAAATADDGGGSAAPDAANGALPSPASSASTLRSWKLPELDDESRAMISDIADPASLGRRGEALVLAQLAAIFFTVFPPHAVTLAVQLSGLAALFGGVAFAAAAVGGIGPASMTPFPAPRKSNKLATKGPFAVVRHPMYAGLAAAALGLALASASPGRLAAAAALVYVLVRKIEVEEAALAERHAGAWAAYCEATPKRLVPYVW